MKKTSSKPQKLNPKKTIAPRQAAAVDPPPLDPPTDARAAYEAMLPSAKDKDASGPFRIDGAVMPNNVKQTTAYVRRRWADLPTHLPMIDLAALASLPTLATAVAFAVLEAERTQPAERVLSEKLAEGRRLRGKLLPVLVGLAASGLIPESEVQDIVRGRGARDVANDCVAIPECFRRHADKITDKHAASDEDIQAAGTVGVFLQANLKSARAKPEKADGPNDAVRTRNQLGALLTERYELARRVAGYFEGDLASDFVPALNARKAPTRTETTTPTPPAPPATPSTPAPAPSTPTPPSTPKDEEPSAS